MHPVIGCMDHSRVAPRGPRGGIVGWHMHPTRMHVGGKVQEHVKEGVEGWICTSHPR